MGDTIFHWIDLIWLPLTWFVVVKEHRFYALGFVLACIFSLRLQYELLVTMHAEEEGLFGIIAMDPFARGLVTYGFFVFGFLVLSHYSPRTGGVIYMAAAISLYFAAFIVSMLFMAI
ncbi:MAG: hypothetical protein EOM26_09700 [Alphaproteobacteria bacterium]|nr:hypothetical protein [Alphaproteobacteria bacterium]